MRNYFEPGTDGYYNRKAKVLQHYKNKSLYHFGKKRYIIVKTATIQSQLAEISESRQKRESTESRLDEIYTILDGLKNHPMEYDDQIVRQIIECVIVESKEQIRVIFAGGLEVTQSLV